jgi:hypothetical protein
LEKGDNQVVGAELIESTEQNALKQKDAQEADGYVDAYYGEAQLEAEAKQNAKEVAAAQAKQDAENKAKQDAVEWSIRGKQQRSLVEDSSAEVQYKEDIIAAASAAAKADADAAKNVAYEDAEMKGEGKTTHSFIEEASNATPNKDSSSNWVTSQNYEGPSEYPSDAEFAIPAADSGNKGGDGGWINWAFQSIKKLAPANRLQLETKEFPVPSFMNDTVVNETFRSDPLKQDLYLLRQGETQLRNIDFTVPSASVSTTQAGFAPEYVDAPTKGVEVQDMHEYKYENKVFTSNDTDKKYYGPKPFNNPLYSKPYFPSAETYKPKVITPQKKFKKQRKYQFKPFAQEVKKNDVFTPDLLNLPNYLPIKTKTVPNNSMQADLFSSPSYKPSPPTPSSVHINVSIGTPVFKSAKAKLTQPVIHTHTLTTQGIITTPSATLSKILSPKTGFLETQVKAAQASNEDQILASKLAQEQDAMASVDHASALVQELMNNIDIATNPKSAEEQQKRDTETVTHVEEAASSIADAAPKDDAENIVNQQIKAMENTLANMNQDLSGL